MLEIAYCQARYLFRMIRKYFLSNEILGEKHRDWVLKRKGLRLNFAQNNCGIIGALDGYPTGILYAGLRHHIDNLLF